MGREWKPGDVAVIEVGCWSNRAIGLRLSDGWSHEHGANRDSDGVVTVVRPLVVIDPEDREQVERLADAFCTARWSHLSDSDECDPLTRSSMDAALRSLIEPPHPPEPQGLGAVVEDENGLCWVLANNEGGWFSVDGYHVNSYSNLAVREIKSQGWSE